MNNIFWIPSGFALYAISLYRMTIKNLFDIYWKRHYLQFA